MAKQLTIFLPAGYSASFTTDSITSGSYVRTEPGGTRYTPITVSVSTSYVIGPFNDPRTYFFNYSGTDLSITQAASGVFAQTDEPSSVTAYTPTLSGDDTAGEGTYTTQVGYYQQNGKVVTFSGNIVWTAHTGVGDFTINVPVAGKTGLTQVIIAQPVSVAGSLSPTYIEIPEGSTTAVLSYVNSSTRTAVPVEAAGELYFSGSYLVD